MIVVGALLVGFFTFSILMLLGEQETESDMLAALQAMLLNMKNDGGAYRDCFKVAEAAIAKATGAK